MSEDKIKIKGENDGLMLAFPADMSFAEIMEELGKKLESGSGFFLRGTLVYVPRDRFPKEELHELAYPVHTHGSICPQERPPRAMRTAGERPPGEGNPPRRHAASPAGPPSQRELRQLPVTEKPLRRGQEVSTT